MKTRLLWFILVLAIGAAFLAPDIGRAYITPNVKQITVNNDWFYNHDFNNTQNLLPSNTDWPVTMIWGYGANINDVKDWLDSHGWGREGSTKWDYVYEYENQNKPEWDGDSGMTGFCEGSSYTKGCQSPFTQLRQKHTRLYAPTDSPYYDCFYNHGFGYFIIATTHYDYEHSTCGTSWCYWEWFGQSEWVEDFISNQADDDFGVTRDWLPIYNSGYGWKEPAEKNYYQSDGKATWVSFLP